MQTRNKTHLFIVLLLTLSACKNISPNTQSYLQYRTDSVRFDASRKLISSLDYASSAKYYFDSAEQKEYIIQASFRDATLYFYRPNGKLEKVISPKEVPAKSIWDFYVVNNNLFYFSDGYGYTYVCDSNKLIHSYKIIRSLDDAYYCYSLQPNTDLKMATDSTFYLMMVDRTSDPSLPDWQMHRHVPPCMGKFTIKNDSVLCIDSVGYFPDDYKRVYHYEIYPTAAISDKRIVYAFSDGDSLFVKDIDSRTPRIAIAINTYIKDFKPLRFERDSLRNISYVEKYFVESPCVSLLKYDPYNKVYYLGIQDGIKYASEDGYRVHDVSDGPSELVVLNEKFEKIKSVSLPGGVFRRLSKAVITPTGIYLRLNSKRDLMYEKFTFF